MNLVCKIGVATAAIAATLTIACNFFDAEDAANTTPSPTRIKQATTAIDPTSHISDVPFPTLHLEPDRRPGQPPLSSTPTGPTPLTEADQKLIEDKRWCQAWALDNLSPLVYLDFAKLDPTNMDDFQRTVWRERLSSSSGTNTCRIYGAERLSKANAHKRNRQYEGDCLFGLVQAADRQWPILAEAAVSAEDTAAYDIPNQYVRVLRWMHLTGDEMLEMVDPPYELLKRLRDKEYAYVGRAYIPSTNEITNWKAQHGEDFSTEWWNLVGAAHIAACPTYYPQLFYGYWTPFAEPGGDDKHEIPAELADQIRRVLEGPLYLPKP